MRRLVFALPLSFVALLLGSRPSAQSGSLVVTAVTIDYVAQTITIRGSGFGTIAPSVSLSGTALTLQSFSSTSQVIVASLPGVTPGSYDLRITAGQNKVTDFDVTIGSTGPQGPPGSQGAIGPSGPQGSTGPLGPQGPQGLKGDVGSPGPKGETGAQGVKGDPGPTGAQGDPGAAGSAGIQGPIGLTGPTGPQGPAGIDGAPFGLPFSGTYSTGGITPAFHIDGGSGVGAQFSNNSSDWPALQAFSFGDGRALEVRKKIGTAGSAAFFSNAGDGPVLDVHAAGNGRAAQFVIDSTSNPSAALFAANPNLLGWAASFQGNVEVTGGLTINGQPAGLQGPIGPAGPQGSQGPKGDPGGTGPLGPAGATGAVGPAGPQGPAGVPFALPFQGADTSDADAIFITKGGNHGAATVLESVSPTNSSTAFTVYNFGTGTASDSRNFNQTSTAVALAATHFGLGGAGAFAIDNPANPAAALTASTNGTGNAAQFFGNVDVSGALTVNGLPIGQQGPAGPQGPPGPQGAQGLAGPQGPQGPTGPSSSACHRIESIPYQISSPGVYCLVSDLETSMTAGTAITIASGNVTLDLQGFTLRNLAGATQAFAIKNADGILVPLTVIRNGRLANFLQSVMINSPGDSRVLIEQLEIYNSLGVAIEVHGDMADVRNNRVYSVGGSATSPGFAFGILASGTRCRVRGNWVENVFASAGGGEAIGIAVSGSEIRISDNAILSVYGSPVLNTGITCQGTAIRITGNDVVIPTGLPGYAWNSVAGVPCQDLGGNTYSGLPPG